MTRRSIQVGPNPHVTVHAGIGVRVTGWDKGQVQVETDNRRPGMKLEGKSTTVEVSFGGSGEVRVPFGSRVSASAGRDVSISGVETVVEASAGHDVSLECRVIEGDKITFSCGHDLRCGIRELPSTTIDVHDAGGRWQGRIGGGRVQIRLRAGGVATLVTDEAVTALRRQGVLGNIERFDASVTSAIASGEQATSLQRHS